MPVHSEILIFVFDLLFFESACPGPCGSTTDVSGSNQKHAVVRRALPLAQVKVM